MKEAYTKLGLTCDTPELREDIYFPAFNIHARTCILQAQELLFSCVGAAADLQRLCPCRNFIKGQTAICQECL